jgi:hypothetical protein
MSSKSHIVLTNKGGVGKSFFSELLCEGLNEIGTPAALVEIETTEARLKRLADTGRVRGHGFVAMVGGEEMMANPNAAITFWESPMQFAVSNAPVVVDIGAQGFKEFEFYAGLDVETSPFGADDGQHGKSMVFWVVTDTSADGVKAAADASTKLRDLFPGAEIVVVGNLGADLPSVQRIAAAAPGIRTMTIATAPDLEIYRPFHLAGGIYGTVALMEDKRAALAKGAALGFERVVMLMAVQRIKAWSAASLSSVVAMIRETSHISLEAAAAE